MFTGINCSGYVLQWRIATQCDTSADELYVSFYHYPVAPDAGPRPTFTNGTLSATMAANSPGAGEGSGQWSIYSGQGGAFSDINNASATFTGLARTQYILEWVTSTDCQSLSDFMEVGFFNDGPGENVTDIQGNVYSTVWDWPATAGLQKTWPPLP
ncbi:MAG: hypothetical protein HC896_17990 [Bacteroidales bacterium]|nr:hypothetical protein [Bacteroidales bacterium]